MSTPTPAAALAAYRRACDTHKRADWRMACHLLAAVVEASQGRPPSRAPKPPKPNLPVTLPLKLRRLIVRMLAPAPADRPQMAVVLSELERVMDTAGRWRIAVGAVAASAALGLLLAAGRLLWPPAKVAVPDAPPPVVLSTRATAVLQQGCRAAEVSTRAAAARAIGQSGASDLGEPLIRLLADPEPSPRLQAACGAVRSAAAGRSPRSRAGRLRAGGHAAPPRCRAGAAGRGWNRACSRCSRRRGWRRR